MTEERRRELDDELDAAIASGDAPKIKQVRRKMEREMLECTAHTTARIKRMEQTLNETNASVADLRDDWTELKARFCGGLTALRIIKYLAASLGGAGLLELLTKINF